ncbi:hypothetical protein E2C01_048413 [Portunus trituberculatus]|uniref:Uncharacterized protein n=1 Tax=Portunus trituberculatus TaxID=210409 RepID=A0A5B7GDB2_PORTR|nr:hypothetical protein [Portunus trituberculatus]
MSIRGVTSVAKETETPWEESKMAE